VGESAANFYFNTSLNGRWQRRRASALPREVTPMLTILDFQVTRVAQETFHIDVCEGGRSQPLASATME